MKQKRLYTLLASMLLVVVVTGRITGQQAPNTAASQASPEYVPAKGTLARRSSGASVSLRCLLLSQRFGEMGDCACLGKSGERIEPHRHVDTREA